MAEQDWLAGQFEHNREHLQAVAYSMLGTVSEAQDAVQEAWLRLQRSEPGAIGDLRGWLTTVVGRISLDMLRARKARREVYPGSWLPEPLVDDGAADGPEHEAVLADSVGMALLVVLETLSPAERLSFVLHDVFAVPFDDVAQIMDRTPDSARQLASRARRRVRGAAPPPDRDLARQRRVVDAFFAAARGGDFAALVAVLDPDVVLRADGGALPGASAVLHGSEAVAGQALMFAGPSRHALPVLVNGAAGVVITVDGRPVSVMGFTVTGGKIVAIDALVDPERLSRLRLAVLDD